MRKSTGDVLLAWPLCDQIIITAGWQYSDGSAHSAIDLRAATGTPVFAAEGGVVDWVQKWDGSTKTGNQSYGNLVRILHQPYNGGRLQTYYAHLDSVVVKQGQTVKEGELVGFAGNTGNSFGSHLHFEVRLNAARKNPLNWLDADFTTAGNHVRLGSYTSVSREDQKPPGVLKKMLDVSKHQTSFNATAAKAQGIATTLCRCAYASSKDICWDTFVPAVQAAGMQLGAYGFLTAHYTSKASNFSQAQAVMREQVQTWIELCKAKSCTILAIDQELEKGSTMLLVSKTYNTRLLQEAVSMIRAAGLTPLIYTGASWCLSYIDWASIDCDFWIAYYASSAKDSDFVAYADGTFPSGQYGDLLRSIQAAGKLFAWQYGSTGNLGPKYGVGSVNVDRNWQYKDMEEDKPMEFIPVTGKLLEVTKAEKPACQAFASADVNDPKYINLALGTYEIIAMGDSITIGGMTAPWLKIIVDGEAWYCLALSDRCRIEDKPSEPTAPAVDLSELTQAVERLAQAVVELNEKVGTQITDIAEILDKLTAAGAALQ